MRKLRACFVRAGELFQRARRDQELAEELESHIQLHADDNLRAGMTLVEARRQALIKFGGMESTVETYRQRRGFSFGGTVLQDLRYAVRTLKKSPGFTIAVVLSLALGIGANTAIFSLMNAVMLKFLPVKSPEQLVFLKATSRQITGFQIANGQDQAGRFFSTAFSYPTFELLRGNHAVFSSAIAFAGAGNINFNADGQAGLAEGELASGNFFTGLGVRAAAGRLFTDSDDQPDSPPTAVISYGYWERRFGRNISAVGKSVAINGTPFTIVGIASPEFFGLHPGTATEVWMPLSAQPQVEPGLGKGRSKFLQRDDWWLQIMARLQPGVTQPQALAQLDIVFKRSIMDPETKTLALSDLPSLEFDPAGRGFQNLRNKFSQPLLILMAVVSLVLLIACANVANLLLARATSRHREIAVRLAVGAARTRLIRQLLTESLLLAVIAGAFGLALAYFASHLIVAFLSNGREPISLNVQLDLRVLGFTAAVSLFTGIIFGLVPALRSTRLDLTASLRKNSKGSTAKGGPIRIGLGRVLVVSQVAISVLLLAGAGLFVRTLVNLEEVNIGFDRQGLLLFGIDPTLNGYQGERLKEFYKVLHERLEAIRGVRSASFADTALAGDYALLRGPILVDEQTGNGMPTPSQMAYESEVGPGFFRTMGIPVLHGRPIEGGYESGQPKVAVVNEAFARKYFAGTSPIGHRIGFGVADSEIIGVVADTTVENLRKGIGPTVFVPFLQDLNFGAVIFGIRTIGDPKAILPGVRLAVQSLDPNVPLSNIRTQVEQIDQTLFQERLFAKLSSFFGLLALVLACIGLYGIMSYSVARRTNEIGIRIALGARQEDILRTVMWQALLLVFVGVGLGVPVALGVLRLISSMLFGLKPTDALTMASAIALMLVVATIAGYLPAKRASRVDPMVALRYE